MGARAPEVTSYEVGPRDGLQNEFGCLSTATKLELIVRLAASGLQRIEATSFVSPKWIPQLADGDALANLQAGYEAGVRTFDSSLGGLGGCPYAPGASGNVATEDVVDLFEHAGVATGVDLDALVETSAWLENDVLHRPLPGRVFRARLAQRRRTAGGEEFV
ncbi:MAG: hypothetical protein V3T33_02560 [Myxococcota bacterium]